MNMYRGYTERGCIIDIEGDLLMFNIYKYIAYGMGASGGHAHVVTLAMISSLGEGGGGGGYSCILLLLCSSIPASG